MQEGRSAHGVKAWTTVTDILRPARTDEARSLHAPALRSSESIPGRELPLMEIGVSV